MSIMIDFLKSHLNILIGFGILILAFINGGHASTQQDIAWDMSTDTGTAKICRQIRLLETRIWVLGWWVMAGVGAIVIFIN